MKYQLVIKTNSYGGNFEREMCAFLTGITGECEVGREMGDLLQEEEGVDLDALGFESCVDQVADDSGCFRPVSLDHKNSNNIVIHFYKKPSDEQIKHIKTYAPMFDEYHKSFGRMKQFNKDKPKIKVLGYELRTVKTETVEEEI